MENQLCGIIESTLDHLVTMIGHLSAYYGHTDSRAQSVRHGYPMSPSVETWVAAGVKFRSWANQEHAAADGRYRSRATLAFQSAVHQKMASVLRFLDEIIAKVDAMALQGMHDVRQIPPRIGVQFTNPFDGGKAIACHRTEEMDARENQLRNVVWPCLSYELERVKASIDELQSYSEVLVDWYFM